MTAETEFSPITKCPAAGDRIFILDNGAMRPATVELCEDGQKIDFTFEDDGMAWSMVAFLPHSFNPLEFTPAGFNRRMFKVAEQG